MIVVRTCTFCELPAVIVTGSRSEPNAMIAERSATILRRDFMRILVGTTEIAGLIGDFADGFRQLGHEVTSVVSNRHPSYPNLSYDVELYPWASMGSKPSPTKSSIPDSILRVARGAANRITGARVVPLLMEHDVFVFPWAEGV
jgi:hypothetical protein